VSKRNKTDVVLQDPVETAFPALPLGMPLVLDLDGTLIRSDLLFESFVAALKKNPLVALLSIWWLITGGAARLKQRLAVIAITDTDLIPINADIVALAENEKLVRNPITLRHIRRLRSSWHSVAV
jgi:hypothetical protein